MVDIIQTEENAITKVSKIESVEVSTNAVFKTYEMKVVDQDNKKFSVTVVDQKDKAPKITNIQP